MNIDVRKNETLRHVLVRTLALIAIGFIASCAKSPTPTVSADVAVSAPVFDNGAQKLTIASNSTILTGKCDTKAQELQYTTDGVTWQSVPGGCTPSGRFSFKIAVPRTVNVGARSQLNIFYSAVTPLSITFAPPPTSSSMVFTVASSSNSDLAPNMQGVMGYSFSGEKLTNQNLTILTYLPRMIYGGP